MEQILSSQLQAFSEWKRKLVIELTRYRSWLKTNRLDSEEFEQRLNHNLQYLKSDNISLAFVGEFSRGKTELINALFFARFGQRMLPSRIGRTTMCPTELFFDKKADTSYVRLLPIETRGGDTSIARFKQIPDKWIQLPLDTDNLDQMTRVFREVANSKSVSMETAGKLGFDTQVLERCPDVPGNVIIPAWRHALISFDHPLLRQGLSIIDTPGLNALGCEPELTLNLLPEAHAIIFLLGADTGLTATDMAIWQDYIQPLAESRPMNLYGVLNKIDLLWDDLTDPSETTEAITRLAQQTAAKLQIPAKNIVPLSAKQGLLGQVRENDALLSESNLPALEQLLTHAILDAKESRIREYIVNNALLMMENSRQLTSQRIHKLQEQLQLVASDRSYQQDQAFALGKRAKQEQAMYQKRMLVLKSARKHLENEKGKLLSIYPPETARQLRQALLAETASPNSQAIHTALMNYLGKLHTAMVAMGKQVEAIEKNIRQIYAQYKKEFNVPTLDYPKLDTEPFFAQLGAIEQQVQQFSGQSRNLFRQQKNVETRFFHTLLDQCDKVHLDFCRQAAAWCDEALGPVMQQALEQKRLMDDYLVQLKSLEMSTRDQHSQQEKMNQTLMRLEQQAAELDRIIRALRTPSPTQRNSKVVELPHGQSRG